MKKKIIFIMQLLVCIIFIFAENNIAQQNDYIGGLDSNQIITVSNYAPKLNEIVTITAKYYHTQTYAKIVGIPGLPYKLRLLYNEKLEKDSMFSVIEYNLTRSNENKIPVDSIMMKVEFHKKGIYYFDTFLSADYGGLRIPIYVEGRLPHSDPLKEIKERLKELKRNVKKLESLPAKGIARLVSSHGLKYIKPEYNPKTDYEMSIYKDIEWNNRNKYETYWKEFVYWHAIQNLLYVEWRQKGINPAQQKDYVIGIDTNQVVTVSNYTPKLNEVVAIRVKFRKYSKDSRRKISPKLEPDKNAIRNKDYTIISHKEITTEDAGREVEIISMLVKFHRASIYYFTTYCYYNKPILKIPIYVEGRLPKSNPLREIKERLNKLKQNVNKLKALPATGKARLVSNNGLEYIEPEYHPKNEYEVNIFKDIVDNSKLKYDAYKKEFDSLYTIQSALFQEWVQRRDE